MASAVTLPPLTPNLEILKLHLKFATKFDESDPEIAFWCRVYAYQRGLYKLSEDGTIREENDFMAALYEFLANIRETSEKQLIKDENTAEAYFKQLVVDYFTEADEQDRAGVFNEELVRTFFSASMFADILGVFNHGLKVHDEYDHIRKYSKWKTCQIHTCLKAGTTPHSGMPEDIAIKLRLVEEVDDEDDEIEEAPYDSNANSLARTTSAEPNIIDISGDESEQSEEVSSRDRRARSSPS